MWILWGLFFFHSLLSSRPMDCVTIVVRWTREPKCHINVCGSHLDMQPQKWYMSRWERENILHPDGGPVDLTVVCFQCHYRYSEEIADRIMTTMKNLWSDRDSNVMKRTKLDLVLQGNTNDRCNSYAILFNRDLKRDMSFYEHVSRFEGILIAAGCQGKPSSTLADNDTLFKLHCEHVSLEIIHSLPR